jgi:lysozyme
MAFQTFYGIDTSQWQGDITQADVDAVKQAGKSFWYFKGSGGDDGNYVDTKFQSTLNIVRPSGLKLGVYHFAGMTDPVAEANFALDNCWKKLLPGEMPILDVDRAFPADPSWTKSFCEVADAALGIPVVLYMNQETENNYDWKGLGLTDRGLIVADYAVSPDGNVALKNWPFYLGQQYSSTGSVGALSPVDLDAIFVTDLSVWDKYAIPEPAPVVVAPPTTVVKPTGGTAIDVVVKAVPPPIQTATPKAVVMPQPVTQGVSMKAKIKDLLERAGWTFIQAAAAVLVVSGGTVNKAALVAALAAGISAVKSAIKQSVN